MTIKDPGMKEMVQDLIKHICAVFCTAAGTDQQKDAMELEQLFISKLPLDLRHDYKMVVETTKRLHALGQEPETDEDLQEQALELYENEEFLNAHFAVVLEGAIELDAQSFASLFIEKPPKPILH